MQTLLAPGLGTEGQSEQGNITGRQQVTQELCRAPSLAHTFINDWDTGLEGVGNKFADDTKLGGAVDSLKGRDADRLDGQSPTV